MADVDEIIDYIKSLKKGFDKELFQSKVDELGYLVSTIGLDYTDFHTLFKVWLNLSIPIPKWVDLGACIVPQEKVKQKTVEYSLQWILANFDTTNNTTKTGFLLDWLTAAMDTDSIDMTALDIGYEVFYTLLTYEALTPYVMKLLYTLTKPADVTRKRVLELIDLAKKREGKKNMFRQIQVLLGLFKSYKPQCVPEAVPSISIHTAFRNINVQLLTQFKNSQSKRNSISKETAHLFWSNPFNSISQKKKADPLIPSMEFVNIGSQQYEDSLKKNYLDFSDPVSLLQYSSRHDTRRPARLRALLCNPTGLALLVAASDSEHAFLSYDLHRVLNHCFLEHSPYSYAEKQHFLHRLATCQATLLQGLPVVTLFLARYLPFWNEKDFFAEILQLMEWVNAEGAEHVKAIVSAAARAYHRAAPLPQRALLASLTRMYTNLVYASTRERHYFLSMRPSEAAFANTLALVASRISDMCNKGLQASPESMCVMYSVVRASVAMACVEARCGRAVGAVPRALTLALPLLAPSAAALDSLAALLLLYKKIFSGAKMRADRKDVQCLQQKQILQRFSIDFISCFYEQILSERKRGYIFSKLHPQILGKLTDLIPDADSKFSIRNHLAFAPYTYVKVLGLDSREAENKMWFNTVIQEEFDSLSQFVTRAMPEFQAT
ncbi:centromere protein I-like [Maniola jurtina]|uniref:centromere protein I-like n=1 Tax=Maniola jurtina TaxID=191418 RepID=UPI001E688542|nr:centromere protein I-like [Maniola jurtina]